MDGVRDKDEDAVDVIERGVGPLEGEDTDRAIRAGGGSGSGVDTTEVVTVSVTAVKLPKLVNGETLGRINDVSKELSRPS